MKTDTVLKKEDITDMVSQIEAVEEEANTEVMERIKIGSNNICIRNDLAKKDMMFSQESCQVIIEMGNVELIGLISRFRLHPRIAKSEASILVELTIDSARNWWLNHL